MGLFDDLLEEEGIAVQPAPSKPKSSGLFDDLLEEEGLTQTAAPQKPREFFSFGDTFSALSRVPEAVVTTVPAAVQKMYRGLDMPESSSILDREAEFQKSVQEDQARREASGEATSVGSAIREALPSLGFSLGGIVPAIGGAFVGSKLGGSKGGTAGAMAASGLTSYRMAGADFLNRSMESLEERKGAPLDENERQRAYEEFLPLAQNSALWEAGPEAVSNALMLKAGKFVFNLFPKAGAAPSLAKRAIVGTGAVGAEIASEGETAMGQYKPEMAAQQYIQTGSTEGAPTDYPGGRAQAYKDVAPATLALMGMGAATAGGVKLATLPFQQKPAESPQQDPENFDPPPPPPPGQDPDEDPNFGITDEDRREIEQELQRRKQAAVEAIEKVAQDAEDSGVLPETAQALREQAQVTRATPTPKPVDDPNQAAPAKAPFVTEVAKTFAQDRGVDISQVPANQFGRVTKKDVEKFLKSQPTQTPPTDEIQQPPNQPAPTSPATPPPVVEPPSATAPPQSEGVLPVLPTETQVTPPTSGNVPPVQGDTASGQQGGTTIKQVPEGAETYVNSDTGELNFWDDALDDWVPTGQFPEGKKTPSPVTTVEPAAPVAKAATPPAQATPAAEPISSSDLSFAYKRGKTGILIKGAEAGFFKQDKNGGIKDIQIAEGFDPTTVTKTVLDELSLLRGENIVPVSGLSKKAADLLSKIGSLDINIMGDGTLTLPEPQTETPVETPPTANQQTQPLAFTDIQFTDSPEFNPDTGKTARSSGTAQVVSMADRQIVLVNVNGVPVPFYLSTGKAGKKNVAAGKWYPILGLDVDGWINKGSQQEISSYYGSPLLQSIAERLDNELGTTTPARKVSSKSIVDSINQGLASIGITPVSNGTSTTKSAIADNIAKLVAFADSPTTPVVSEKRVRPSKKTPIISEIPQTSELVGSEPTQPIIREIPQTSPIVGSETPQVAPVEPAPPSETPIVPEPFKPPGYSQKRPGDNPKLIFTAPQKGIAVPLDEVEKEINSFDRVKVREFLSKANRGDESLGAAGLVPPTVKNYSLNNAVTVGLRDKGQGRVSSVSRYSGQMEDRDLRDLAVLQSLTDGRPTVTFVKKAGGPDRLFEIKTGAQSNNLAFLADQFRKAGILEPTFELDPVTDNEDKFLYNRVTVYVVSQGGKIPTEVVNEFAKQNDYELKVRTGISETFSGTREKLGEFLRTSYQDRIQAYDYRGRRAGVLHPADFLWELARERGIDLGEKPYSLVDVEGTKKATSLSQLQKSKEGLEKAYSQVGPLKREQMDLRLAWAYNAINRALGIDRPKLVFDDPETGKPFKSLSEVIRGAKESGNPFPEFSGYPVAIREYLSQVAYENALIKLSETSRGVFKDKRGTAAAEAAKAEVMAQIDELKSTFSGKPTKEQSAALRELQKKLKEASTQKDPWSLDRKGLEAWAFNLLKNARTQVEIVRKNRINEGLEEVSYGDTEDATKPNKYAGQGEDTEGGRLLSFEEVAGDSSRDTLGLEERKQLYDKIRDSRIPMVDRLALAKTAIDNGVFSRGELGGLGPAVADFYDQYSGEDIKRQLESKEINETRRRILQNTLENLKRPVSVAKELAESYTIEQLFNNEHRDEMGQLKDGYLNRLLQEIDNTIGSQWDALSSGKLRFRSGDIEEIFARTAPNLVRATDAKQLLEGLLKSNVGKQDAKLLRTLLQNSKVLEQIPVNFYDYLSGNPYGQYNRFTGEIDLNLEKVGEGGDMETSVHEVSHSLLEYFLEPNNRNLLNARQRKLVGDLNNLYTQTKKIVSEKGLFEGNFELQEQFSNINEWTAAMMSNPQFKGILQEMSLRDTVTGKMRSVWEAFKDFVAKIFGIDRSVYAKSFDKVLELSLDSEAGFLSDSPGVRNMSPRWNQLTADLQGRDLTQADIDAWKKANPEKYAELEKMREDAIKSSANSNGQRVFGPLWHISGEKGLSGNKFDPNKIGSQTDSGYLARGFYFAGSEDAAKNSVGLQTSRAGKSYQVFVGFKNPLEATLQSKSEGNWRYNAANKAVIEELAKIVTPQKWNEFLTINNYSAEDLRKLGLRPPSEIKNRDLNFYNFSLNAYNELFNFLGIDGIVTKRNDGTLFEVVGLSPVKNSVFDPNQIKSAEPLNLENGRLVPPTEWAQPENPDIRFRKDNSNAPQRPLRGEDRVSGTSENFSGNIPADERVEYFSQTVGQAYSVARQWVDNGGRLQDLFDRTRTTLTEPEVLQAASILGNKAAGLKSQLSKKPNLTAAEIVALHRAEDEAKEADKLIVKMSSEAGQILGHKQHLDPVTRINVDSVIKAFLGGRTPEQILVDNRVDIQKMVQGLSDIRAEAAQATLNVSKTSLEGAGLDAEDLQTLQTLLSHPSATFKQLKNALATLGATRSGAENAALAEKLFRLFSVSTSSIAKSKLPQLVVDTYSGKGAKPATDRFLAKMEEFLKLGKFNEDDISNTLLQSLGLTGFDVNFIKSIRADVEKVAATPEGDLRNQASVDVLKKVRSKFYAQILNDFGKSMADTETRKHVYNMLTAMWQAGVLSGPPTAMVNLVGSAASVGTESLMTSIGYASKTGDIRYFADIVSGFLSAIVGNKTTGLPSSAMAEVKSALTGSGTRYRNMLLDEAPQLENIDISQLTGPIKYLAGYGGALKWVGRVLSSLDAINMSAADEAMQRMAMRFFISQEKGITRAETNRILQDLFDPDERVVSEQRLQAEREVKESFGDRSAKEQQRYIAKRTRELLALRREEILPGIREIGKDTAQRFTYNETARGFLGSTLVNFSTQINNKIPAGRFILSFMNTLANIMNQTLDYTPYGYMRANNTSFSQSRSKNNKSDRFAPRYYTEGSPEQAAQIARATLGTSVILSLAFLAYKSLEEEEAGGDPYFTVTGAGPSNAMDKQQLIDTKRWKANSIKIGDEWIRYVDIPILGPVFGGLGTVMDSVRYRKDEQTTGEVVQQAAISAVTTILDKQLLQGANNFFEMLKGRPGTQTLAAKRLVGGIVSGYTNPGLARWIRNTVDADEKGMVDRLDQSNTTGWLMSMVPFSIGYNTPALNTLGEPIQQPWYSATTWRFIESNSGVPHPIITPLIQAGLMLPNPSKITQFRFLDETTGEIVTTKLGKYPEVMRRYTEVRGDLIKRALTPGALEGLARAAKIDLNKAQSLLDERVGNKARDAAVKIIEKEILDGKLSL